MIKLNPQDLRYLEAAEGWCGLNSFLEANEELEKISPQARVHPKVLEIRWQIYANLEKWEGALEIANALTKLMPNQPKGWVYLAESQSKMNWLNTACDTLVFAADRFPNDKVVHYDLACICCKANRIPEAEKALMKAIDLGGNEIKLKALEDDDLEPIWKNLK